MDAVLQAVDWVQAMMGAVAQNQTPEAAPPDLLNFGFGSIWRRDLFLGGPFGRLLPPERPGRHSAWENGFSPLIVGRDKRGLSKETVSSPARMARLRHPREATLALAMDTM